MNLRRISKNSVLSLSLLYYKYIYNSKKSFSFFERKKEYKIVEVILQQKKPQWRD